MRALRVCLAVCALAGCGDNTPGAADARADAPAAPRVIVTLDPARAGAAIPEDFLGASYETSTLIGGAYFAPENAALLRTVATLGLAHLRIGGNESDVGPTPALADIARFAAFANAAGVRVIYTLRLKTEDPAAAASVAHAVLADSIAGLDCFAIGNEPSFYLPDYPSYRAAVLAYLAAIADPRARVCGPDVFGTAWMVPYATDFAARPDFRSANVHIYYGNGQGIAAADARALLLSPELAAQYEADYASYAPAVLATGAPLRVSEVNSFYSGGCPGASDAFASALWGLDYLHWWAAHQAAGVDFHTGDHVSGATTTYSLFKTAPTGGYHVRPLGYAVKAFDLARHGRIVPVTITGASVHVTAYGVLAADGRLWVTIVNKTHDAGAIDAALVVRPGAGFTAGRAWRLAAGGDVAALDGVTLGGAPIADDASWAGSAEAVTVTDEAVLPLPGASAVVLVLEP